MCSTCCGQKCIYHQELATILLNYHIDLLFLVRCVLEFRCGWFGVVSVLQVEASACNTDTTPIQLHRISNTHRTKKKTTNVAIQQNIRKLLMMDILMSETCWAYKKWNKIASDLKFVFYSSIITMMHSPINIRLSWYFNIISKTVYLQQVQSSLILTAITHWFLSFKV